MRFLKIKEIGKVISGSTPSTDIPEYWYGDIPWVTPKEINRLETPFLNDTERKITEAGFKASSTTLLPKGSILFTSRAPIGLVAIANIDVTTNQGFKSLHLFNGFYPLYIYYALKHFSKRIEYFGTGTTFKELSKTTFEEFEIPVPEKLEDQVRIATLLHDTSSLISQRKESISLLNELLRSSFLDMFGDPIRNEKSWTKKPLDKLVAKDCPLTYGIVQPGENVQSGTPVVRPTDLFRSHITRENLKRIDPKISKRFSRTILRGDEILMCVRGTTGMVSLATRDLKGCNVTRGITPIWFNKTINREFAFQLFSSEQVKKEIQKYTYGTALQQINLVDLRSLQLINPPISLQNRYGKLSSAIFKIKALFENSLLQLENLYSSLNQKAFKGSLNLTGVPLDQNKLLETSKLKYSEKTDLLQKEVKNKQEVKDIGITPQKQKRKFQNRIGWDSVSTETIANWIKEKYSGFHFNNEMLTRFLTNEHVTFLSYFSSEELKKIPSLNSKDDLKKFLFYALNDETPYLKLKQHFYNAQAKNVDIRLAPEDEIFMSTLNEEEQSGIYFSIEDI